MTSSNIPTEVEGLIPYNGTKTQLERPTKVAITSMGWGSQILLYLNRRVQTLEEEIWLG